MIAALRRRGADDTGMTLMEVLITSTILVVVLGMVLISLNLIETISSSVTAQYQEFNQVIPSLAPVRSLVAAEVEPAPVNYSVNPSGVPTPAFSVVGSATPTSPPYTGSTVVPYSMNFAVSWYANIGISHGNVVASSSQCQPTCTAGPAKIVALEVDGNGHGVTSATSCNVSSPCGLQVWEYLPLVGYPWSSASGVSTCPVPVNGTLNGTCQYAPMNADETPCTGSPSTCYYWPLNADGTPAAASSHYASTYRLVANILDVVNDPSAGASDPIFSFVMADTTNTPYPLLATDLNQNPPVLSTVPGSPSLLTCTGSSLALCPLDAVLSVGIHLQVDAAGSGTNGQVENGIIDYRQPLGLQQPGATCLPFQYDPTLQCDPYQS